MKYFSGLDEQPGIVIGTGSIPALEIQIRDGHGIDGNVIRHASIGQPLTLDITLKNTGIFEMF